MFTRVQSVHPFPAETVKQKNGVKSTFYRDHREKRIDRPKRKFQGNSELQKEDFAEPTRSQRCIKRKQEK